jgi:WS/DGAT/MGAT family acyltransferase
LLKLIKPNDAAWLLVEKPEQPVHVACLAICSKPEGAPRGYLRDWVDRWRECRHFAPPFNYRYRPGIVPMWEVLDDADIDLEYHLRHSALPEPGGERELGVLVSRLHSHRLDRRRPLWECHVIEGLEHGRFALYVKMHHSQVDGVGGIRMVQRCFTPDAAERDLPPIWSVGMGGRAAAAGEARERAPRQAPAELLREQLDTLRPLGKAMRELLREARSESGSEAAVPFQAPKSVLNGRIHGPRRFATQHYELARIKRLAKRAGATVNDVFVALCAAALRRYLMERHELPTATLTAGLPMSIRPAGDAAVGNAFSMIFARLHTDIRDPLERLEAIGRSARAAKARVEQLPRAAVNHYTMLSMGPYMLQLMLGLGGYSRPLSNIVISNVPGPPDTLYFNGARVEEFYPVSLLFNGQALNISVVSYAGQFNLGFTGCRDSLPSMQRLAVYTGEALEELEQALG